jgi:ankyrin repeat protein
MAINSIKMVVKAHPAAASCQDSSGALPIHWITHNLSCNFELVNYLISAYPKGAMISDMDGYLPLHWAVNQDTPNIGTHSLIHLLTHSPNHLLTQMLLQHY